jgi:hypothetical protein
MENDRLCELIDMDFPNTITKNTVTQKFSNSFRSDARMTMGLFWTDTEYEKMRKTVLNTPLP